MIELGTHVIESISSILCIGAHADDIEIGCAGLLFRLLEINPDVDVTLVVLTAAEERAAEARRSAERLLANGAPCKMLVWQFREAFFPYSGPELKEAFQLLGRQHSPDLVLTHCRQDLHQDHKVASELTWNTFRDHLILEYEIPKYDGDLGSPNFFVQLDKATCERKVAHLMEVFPSQRSKPWFSEETFWAMLRLRGVECRSRTGFAEGYFGRKVVFA